MAKKRTTFFCTACGHESIQWLGKCPQCGLWNSFEQVTLQPALRRGARDTEPAIIQKAKVVPLSNVTVDEKKRLLFGSPEMDRVLGGGAVPETTILLAGEPGIGKSTLLLQLCATVARTRQQSVLYIAAEESLRQVRQRSERLGISGENLYVIAETNMELIEGYIKEIKPQLVIIDSIQAVVDAMIPSAPGTLTQVRENALRLCRLAKESTFTLFLIGHVTKDGVLAGPKSLEHLVDTVIYFEGDRYQSLRIVRAVKNRFGSTGEVGIFEMTAQGLCAIDNPSSIFLSERENITPGRVTVAVMEGRRPFLVEVQALTNKTAYNNPLRRSLGIEVNKISLLIAVIERTLRLNLYTYDVFIKVAGGLYVTEAACDCAVCLAIMSSYRMVTIAPDVVVLGEVGLGGEIRKIQSLEVRIKEAARLGYKEVVVPQNNLRGKKISQIKVTEIGHLRELHNLFLPRPRSNSGSTSVPADERVELV